MAICDQSEAVTLVTERPAHAKVFYRDVFEAALVYEDAVCVMFQVGPTVVNLLSRDAVISLV